MTDMEFSTGTRFILGYRLMDGDDINVIVERVNAMSGLAAQGAVSMKQMRTALKNVSSATLYTVANAIPADLADPVNIDWLSGGTVSPTSSLAAFIKSTLGYSTAQMTALFNAAKLVPP